MNTSYEESRSRIFTYVIGGPLTARESEFREIQEGGQRKLELPRGENYRSQNGRACGATAHTMHVPRNYERVDSSTR